MSTPSLLEVANLTASYGSSQVLFGLSLRIENGEVVSLMGRNGMGKTTTVHAIAGLLHERSGKVRFAGETISDAAPHRVARLGLGLVPEGRRIFPNLSVRENLLMAGLKRGDADWNVDRVLEVFPALAERMANPGNRLSGGEQQMLAIGRALMTNPRLLVLDEATEGLAPIIRDQIWSRLATLKATGLAILVIDKDIDALCDLADRHYVLEKGEIVWTGDSAALRGAADVQSAYLSV